MHLNMPQIIQVVRKWILEFPGPILILCSKIKFLQGGYVKSCILGVSTAIAVLRGWRRTKQMQLNMSQIIQVVRKWILEFPGAILILCSKIKISPGWLCEKLYFGGLNSYISVEGLEANQINAFEHASDNPGCQEMDS